MAVKRANGEEVTDFNHRMRKCTRDVAAEMNRDRYSLHHEHQKLLRSDKGGHYGDEERSNYSQFRKRKMPPEIK